MADRQISELTEATAVQDNDLLVLQQGQTAKKLKGKTLSDWVYEEATENFVVVSDSEPQSERNNIWVDPSEEDVVIPTMDDLGALTAEDISYDSSATHTSGSVGKALADLSDDKVPTTRTVNNKPLSSNVTLSAEDLAYDGSAVSHTSGSVAKELSDQSDRIDTEVEDRSALIWVNVGDNLVDETLSVTGFIQDDGSVASNSSWAYYKTSDYIKIEPSTDYILNLYNATSYAAASSRRGYLLYDNQKSPISGTHYNATSTYNTIINNASAYYVRVSWDASNVVMLSKGNTLVQYKAYTTWPSLNSDIDLTEKMISSVENAAKKAIGKIKLIKNGEFITIENAFGDDVLRRTMYLHDPNRNNATDFYESYIVKNGVSARIHDEYDDVAPQRIYIYNGGSSTDWTIGANHGWPCLQIPTSDTSLTDADIGSTWTDGTTQYVLFGFNSNKAEFLYPCTKTSQELYFTIASPVANLTHVTGATHTTAIPYANAASGQLYPSAVSEVKLSIDGVEITENGTYYGDKIIVSERQKVIDYADAIVYRKANIGVKSLNNISPYIYIDNNYIISPNAVLLEQTIEKRNLCKIANSGVMQSTCLEANGGKIYRYVNNVTSGTFASSNLVDMSSYSTNTNITSDNVTAPNIPDRTVEYHDVNGTVDYGFAMGFIPDIGDSKTTNRASLSTFYDMRNTKKIYPYCFYNIAANEGSYYMGLGYRIYFPTTVKANKTHIKVNNDLYVFADLHSNASFGMIDVPSEYIGAKVSVVYENGLTTKSVLVDNNGICVYCSGGHGSAIYKIS